MSELWSLGKSIRGSREYRRLMWKYVLPLGLSQVADITSTAVALTRGGYEANPVTSFLLGLGGFPLLVMLKLIIVLIAALVMETMLQLPNTPKGARYKSLSKTVINVITIVTFLVAGWNILVAVTS